MGGSMYLVLYIVSSGRLLVFLEKAAAQLIV